MSTVSCVITPSLLDPTTGKPVMAFSDTGEYRGFIPSPLFTALTTRYDRETASQIWGSIHSPKFLSDYGDWRNAESITQTPLGEKYSTGEKKVILELEPLTNEPKLESLLALTGGKDFSLFHQKYVNDADIDFNNKQLNKATLEMNMVKADGKPYVYTDADKAETKKKDVKKRLDKLKGKNNYKYANFEPVVVETSDGVWVVGLIDKRQVNFDVFKDIITPPKSGFANTQQELLTRLKRGAAVFRGILKFVPENEVIQKELAIYDKATKSLIANNNLNAAIDLVLNAPENVFKFLTFVTSDKFMSNNREQRAKLLTQLRDSIELYKLLLDTKFYDSSDLDADLVERRDKAKEQVYAAEALYEKYLKEHLAELISEDGDKKDDLIQIINNMKDTNWVAQMLTDLSQSSNPLVQEIGKLLDSIIIKANAAITGKMQEFEVISKAYNQVFGTDYSQFMQLDDFGNETGYFVSKYKPTFINLLKGLRSGKDGVIAVTSKSNIYYKDTNKGVYYNADLSLVSDTDTLKLIDEQISLYQKMDIDGRKSHRANHVARLMNAHAAPAGITVDLTAQLALMETDPIRGAAAMRIELAKLVNSPYPQDQKYAEYLYRLVEYTEIGDAAQVASFDLEFNPMRYQNNLKLLREGDFAQKKLAIAEIRKFQGYKYLEYQQRDENIDPRWVNIQNNPVSKAYYDFVTAQLNKYRKLLPPVFDDSGQLIESNYIPEMQKSFRQELGSSDGWFTSLLSKGWDRVMKEGLLSDIKATKVDTTVDPITGRLQRSIPYYMLTGKMKKEDRNTNMTQVMSSFIVMAETYKQKVNSLEEISLIRETLDMLRESVNDGKDAKQAKDSYLRTKAQTDYALKARLYDDPHADQKGLHTPYVYETLEDKERKQQLRLQIDQIKRKLTDPSVPVELKPALLQEQLIKEQEMENLGRPVDGTKVIDNIVTYTRMKALSFNIPSVVADFFMNTVSALTEAAGNKFFNTKELFQAGGLVSSYLLAEKMSSSRRKLDILSRTLGIERRLADDIHFGRSPIGNDALDRYANTQTAFILQRKVGELSAFSTMVAMLLHDKVNLPDGRVVSLWECFDEKGDWIEPSMPNPFIDENFLVNYSTKVQKVTQSLYGNFDPNKVVQAKEVVLGRAALMFRNWMASTLLNRFGSERYDVIMKETTKGRYRTIGDLYINGAINNNIYDNDGIPRQFTAGEKALRVAQSSLRIMLANKYNPDMKEQYNLNELDFYNMKKNFRELAIMLILAGAYLAVSQIDVDEEDEEDYTALNFLTNRGFKLTKDMMFYFSPAEFAKGIQNPIGMVSTYVDGLKWLDAVASYGMGKEGLEWTEYTDKTKKDESKLGKQTVKMLPFVNGFYSLEKAFRIENSGIGNPSVYYGK